MRCKVCDFSKHVESMYHGSLEGIARSKDNKLVLDERDNTYICLDCLEDIFFDNYELPEID